MAVFTSAYRQLAHGALNWDTQLDADMGTLETILGQGSWTPSLGGTAANLGTGGVATGYATRLGQHVTYNGRLLFGSGCSWGTGTPTILGLTFNGNFDPTTATGTGLWSRAAGGATIPVVLWPGGPSSLIIYVAQSAASTLPYNVAAVGQSDQLIFTASVVLA